MKKKRIRLQASRITPVANKYGLPGNAGFTVIAEAICRATKLQFPKSREEAKEIIRCQPEYGLPYKPKVQNHKAKPKPSFATSDAFLSSYEWRRVRMEALKKYGARCQCCGATPADGVKMNVDHIKPRKIFPHLALDVSNLQVLCEECNHGKGNWDMTDWRPKEGLRPVQDIYGPEIERMCDDAMAHMRSIAGEK